MDDADDYAQDEFDDDIGIEDNEPDKPLAESSKSLVNSKKKGAPGS